MPKVIQVIFDYERRGVGTEKDPVRMVPQLWTLNGDFICEAENTMNPSMDGTGHFGRKVDFEVLRRL